MNDSDIIKIYKLGHETELPRAYIARLFSVNVYTVYRILSREYHADITRGIQINKVEMTSRNKLKKKHIEIQEILDDIIL